MGKKLSLNNKRLINVFLLKEIFKDFAPESVYAKHLCQIYTSTDNWNNKSKLSKKIINDFIHHIEQLNNHQIYEKSLPNVIIDSNLLLSYIIGKSDVNYLATKSFFEIANSLSKIYVTNETLKECERVITNKFSENIKNMYKKFECEKENDKNHGIIQFHPVVISYYNQRRTNKCVSSSCYCNNLFKRLKNTLNEYNITLLKKTDIDMITLLENKKYLKEILFNRSQKAISHDAYLWTLTDMLNKINFVNKEQYFMLTLDRQISKKIMPFKTIDNYGYTFDSIYLHKQLCKEKAKSLHNYFNSLFDVGHLQAKLELELFFATLSIDFSIGRFIGLSEFQNNISNTHF